jgi:hypothetical protein
MEKIEKGNIPFSLYWGKISIVEFQINIEDIGFLGACVIKIDLPFQIQI